jgi:UDP-N-acetylmuramoyl-tripeptide--D-alanyl-D-alanine ligase
MDTTSLYHIFLQYPKVYTDTRQAVPDSIFFALKGPSFDGNQYAQEALEKGAAYAVVDDATIASKNPEKLLLVDDVLTSLQALAKHHREQFNIPFVAITGSNGKTTTKELVAAVLSSHFRTSTTVGNLNNHIGIPLTLLRIPKDTEIAVIEMGANHQKEIESYCTYVQPTHGIITNCGKAHLEGFGGIEGVRKGKGELYDFLRKNKGTIFMYNDYDYLHSMSSGVHEIVGYGTKEGAIIGQSITSNPFLTVGISKGIQFNKIHTHLVGDYNLPNVLCAVAIGKYFNVPDEKILSAIESYNPTNNRSQWMELGGHKIILDAYNANPTSMQAAISNFAALPEENKIVCLGGMMEMGDASLEEHEFLIKNLEQYKWSEVILVGGDFNKVPHNYHFFETAEQAVAWMKQQQFKKSTILIKGSRSMRMETILDTWKD